MERVSKGDGKREERRERRTHRVLEESGHAVHRSDLSLRLDSSKSEEEDPSSNG